jgi:hypothetical protein
MTPQGPVRQHHVDPLSPVGTPEHRSRLVQSFPTRTRVTFGVMFIGALLTLCFVLLSVNGNLGLLSGGANPIDDSIVTYVYPALTTTWVEFNDIFLLGIAVYAAYPVS